MSKSESHKDWEIYIESGKPLPDLRLIKYLLERGARPKFVDLVGVTPLHRAVSRDNFLLCQLLLQANADPNMHDFQLGRTPLHLARSSRVALLLMNYGADFNATNIVGWTPMQFAKKNKRESVMEAIVVKLAKDELNRMGYPSDISHMITLYIVGDQVKNDQAQVEEVEEVEEEAKDKKQDRKEAKEEVDQQSKIRKVREEEKKERKEEIYHDDFAYAFQLQGEEDGEQSKRRKVREVKRNEREEKTHQDDFALALQLQEDLNAQWEDLNAQWEDLNAQWVERPNVGSNENDLVLASFLQEDEYAFL